MPDINLTVVVAAFGVYTFAIVAIGLYSAKFAQRSDEDYFLAGRSLNSWIAGLSASASSESGWVTLGLVGIGYAHGVQGFWVIPGCLLGYLFNWFVLAGRMNRQARALGALTLPDYFAFRFGERTPWIRTLAVIVTLAAMMAYVAAQMAAAGKTFSVVIDAAKTQAAAKTELVEGPTTAGATLKDDEGVSTEYTTGVLIGAAIVLLYTVTGGFRAVCWTDFLQALLMVGALIVFPIYLLAQYGGYGFITEAFRGAGEDVLLDPTGGLVGLALLGFLFGSHALGINFGYPGMPHVLTRFMALKSEREAKLAGVIAFVWGLCVYWGAVTVGMFARALVEDPGSAATWAGVLEADKEVGLVACAIYMLPAVLSGLVVAAVLAAICSTADSQLVVAASAAAYDLWGRIFTGSSKKAHMWVNRLVVLGLGVGAVLLVFDTKIEVYKYVLNYGWAMLGAAFGPQVILAVLWKRASYAGCLAGMLTGFVTVILWGELYDAKATGFEVYNLTVGFCAALVVNVLFSLIFPPRGELLGAAVQTPTPEGELAAAAEREA